MDVTINDSRWQGEWTGTALFVLLCSGISISNALELLFLVLVTFKKRRGLYFWSLLISSFAVLPYSVGFLIRFLEIPDGLIIGDIMNNIGWGIMVTGQSVVLYSRLGILLHNPTILRIVLWMIIVDGVVFYTSTTVVRYGIYSDNDNFNKAFCVIEKTQVTGFCLQEFIISGFYAREVLRYSKIVIQEAVRRIMSELFIINVIIIVLDIALLTLEYLNYPLTQLAFKDLCTAGSSRWSLQFWANWSRWLRHVPIALGGSLTLPWMTCSKERQTPCPYLENCWTMEPFLRNVRGHGFGVPFEVGNAHEDESRNINFLYDLAAAYEV